MFREEGESTFPPGFWRLLAGLFFTAVVCFAIEALCRTVLHLHREPYASPLLREYFPDLVSFGPRFEYFHSNGFFTFASSAPFMYPAPVAVVYKLFFLLPHPLWAFLGFAVAAFLAAAFLLGHLLVARGVAPWRARCFALSLLFCSYPVWFALKQANMEIVIWAIVASGLALFLAGRGYSAAACFGIAAAMKIFPLVYFGLLLGRRQFRQILFGLCTAGVSTVAALWLVLPDIPAAWRNINSGLDKFRFLYMLHRVPEVGFDHSLFAIPKFLMRHLPSPDVYGHILTAYLLVAALLGTSVFFLRIRHLPTTNQIGCLTIASILLPPVSFEYTLVHLLFPLGLLILLAVDLARTRQSLEGLRSALVCLFFCLATVPELIFLGHRFGGEVKCVVLVSLFFIFLVRRFPLPDSTAASFALGRPDPDRTSRR